MSVDVSGYIDVATRIVEFRTKYPEGSLQPADPARPYLIETIGDQTFIVVVAAAYRHPNDTRPGIGMAYEQFPGRTPFTRMSELQNAETAAWGRAIVAALGADAREGIASREEVRNRDAERSTYDESQYGDSPQPQRNTRPAPPPPPAPAPVELTEQDVVAVAQILEDARAALDKETWGNLWKEAAKSQYLEAPIEGAQLGQHLTVIGEKFRTAQPAEAAV